MDDSKLVTYIENALKQGKSKDDIYRDLMKVGWSVDAIASAYTKLQTPVPRNDIPLPWHPVNQGAQAPASVVNKAPSDTAPHQRTARVVLVIGAIFIGLGVFSFIAGNWQGMSSLTKISVIVAGMLVSYTVSFVMSVRGYSRTANSFLLLGSLIYGSGIFLLGQIFHLPIEWPDGFILWFIGVVALGYATEWKPLINLATLFGFIGALGYPWKFIESIAYLSGNRSPLGSTSVSIVLLLIAVAVSAFVALKIRASLPEEFRRRF